jgi:hypothetical protein
VLEWIARGIAPPLRVARWERIRELLRKLPTREQIEQGTTEPVVVELETQNFQVLRAISQFETGQGMHMVLAVMTFEDEYPDAERHAIFGVLDLLGKPVFLTLEDIDRVQKHVANGGARADASYFPIYAVREL